MRTTTSFPRRLLPIVIQIVLAIILLVLIGVMLLPVIVSSR